MVHWQDRTIRFFCLDHTFYIALAGGFGLRKTATVRASHPVLNSASHRIPAMAPFVFTCPATGYDVQHHLDDDQAVSENEYEAIRCPACARLHFINRKTGKPLGQGKG
jgi:hypothetical protein